jgi:hypothetical protein
MRVDRPARGQASVRAGAQQRVSALEFRLHLDWRSRATECQNGEAGDLLSRRPTRNRPARLARVKDSRHGRRSASATCGNCGVQDSLKPSSRRLAKQDSVSRASFLAVLPSKMHDATARLKSECRYYYFADRSAEYANRRLHGAAPECPLSALSDKKQRPAREKGGRFPKVHILIAPFAACDVSVSWLTKKRRSQFLIPTRGNLFNLGRHLWPNHLPPRQKS